MGANLLLLMNPSLFFILYARKLLTHEEICMPHGQWSDIEEKKEVTVFTACARNQKPYIFFMAIQYDSVFFLFFFSLLVILDRE